MICNDNEINHRHSTLPFRLEHLLLHNKIGSTKTIWSFHWTVLSGHIQSERVNQAILSVVPAQLFRSLCWCWYYATELLDQFGIIYMASVLGNAEIATKRRLCQENTQYTSKRDLFYQCRMSKVSASSWSCSPTIKKFGIFASLTTSYVTTYLK